MSLGDLLGMDEPDVIEEVTPEPIKKKLSPFDFVNAINDSKVDLFLEQPEEMEKQYNPYIVNRALSFNSDTVLFANEMNRFHNTPKRSQFEFLKGTIRKKKRYGGWIKAEQESEDMVAIKEFYDYNNDKAKQAMLILTPDQIASIKEKLNKGGLQQKGKK